MILNLWLLQFTYDDKYNMFILIRSVIDNFMSISQGHPTGILNIALLNVF